MTPVHNSRVLFNKIPTGYPIPGETTVYDDTPTIDLDNVALNGGVLLKTIALSIDPHMRGKMRDASIKSYSAAYEVAKPLSNYGVAKVLRSESHKFQPGDFVVGLIDFEKYTVRNDVDALLLINNKFNLPLHSFLGACGSRGQTAYYAWREFVKPNPGDTAFVSTGAGAVGAVFVQLAKEAGYKVIASAGSEKKVEFLKSIGTDVAFNYKTEKTADVLQKHGPVHIYFDNVGGETLEAALSNMADFGLIIACGMASGYNSAPYHVKNLMSIVAKRLTIRGFIASDFHGKYRDEFFQEIPPKYAQGHLKIMEENIIGLENAEEAIVSVQKGTNWGKVVVIVADA
ncbi:alcohol dehydrogenase [Sistotremastrum suecicum HHB10207 ss-3]|uniref:Alcohol dehydrogenase n=1 Tax=Sistotremastrum suecicum HHB10207 ss-3 TaxID=1314776 RepID=A0A166J321_9AGAM|nr:alcohol dehydrogenase [Sistotremastrum suecicum HHB10207 ss-3]